MSALTITDLKRSYRTPEGERQLVVDVPALELADGEFLALAGSSGCGKTTLLNLVAGILQADAGVIRVGGQEMTVRSESRRDELRALFIGYIFQTFNLLQGYSALENVELAMMFGPGPDHALARRLLERVGLGHRLHYRPAQLSVGQQQRVAVARALANRPRLVLADEPTGALDHRHAAEALALIRELCAEQGAALLLVSHDRDVLAQFERVEDFTRINRAAAPRESLA